MSGDASLHHTHDGNLKTALTPRIHALSYLTDDA